MSIIIIIIFIAILIIIIVITIIAIVINIIIIIIQIVVYESYNGCCWLHLPLTIYIRFITYCDR